MIIAVIALGLFAYSLGWKPDISAIGTGIWSGLKTISTAPVTDGWMMLRRFALAVALILAVASAWTPLPPHGNGTYTELQQSIKEYQQAHGLTVDGRWGRNTNTYYLKGL